MLYSIIVSVIAIALGILLIIQINTTQSYVLAELYYKEVVHRDSFDSTTDTPIKIVIYCFDMFYKGSNGHQFVRIEVTKEAYDIFNINDFLIINV